MRNDVKEQQKQTSKRTESVNHVKDDQPERVMVEIMMKMIPQHDCQVIIRGLISSKVVRKPHEAIQTSFTDILMDEEKFQVCVCVCVYVLRNNRQANTHTHARSCKFTCMCTNTARAPNNNNNK